MQGPIRLFYVTENFLPKAAYGLACDHSAKNELCDLISNETWYSESAVN